MPTQLIRCLRQFFKSVYYRYELKKHINNSQVNNASTKKPKHYLELLGIYEQIFITRNLCYTSIRNRTSYSKSPKLPVQLPIFQTNINSTKNHSMSVLSLVTIQYMYII